MTATRRLQDAGEYAVPFMLDAMAEAIRNPAYETKLSDMIEVLPQIGRPAIRPLTAALQMNNDQLKAEIIRALGRIGYPAGAAVPQVRGGEGPVRRSCGLWPPRAFGRSIPGPAALRPRRCSTSSANGTTTTMSPSPRRRT